MSAVAAAAQTEELTVTQLTGLELAVVVDDLQRLQRVLQLQPEQVHGPAGSLALGLAIQLDRVEAAAQLLAAGVDVNAAAPAVSPLGLAIRCGTPAMLRLLLQHGADLAATGGDGLGQLAAIHLAVLCDSGPAVRELVAAGADANAPAAGGPFDGLTPLMLAAGKGQEGSLQALLSFDSTDVEARDSHGRTALVFAAVHDNEACLVHLLAAGADVGAVDEAGMTALMQASAKGAAASVAVLAAFGADLEAANSKSQHQRALHQRALHLAAEGGHQACVRELLLAGAQREAAAFEERFTPLMVATLHGREACLRELLAAGALLTPDSGGCSPLENAAFNGSLACLLTLLEADEGLDAEAATTDSDSALVAAARVGQLACVQALLAVGVPSRRGVSSAMLSALRGGHTACVEELLQAGAAAEGPVGDAGLTPLAMAAVHGRAEVIPLLVAYSASSSTQARAPRSGLTPLMLAVERGHADCVAALLACGAAPNEVAGKDGITALHLAVMHGREACLQQLLQHDGTDKDACTHEGMTAVSCRLQEGVCCLT